MSGRKAKPVLERIQKFLDVNVLAKSIPDHVRDQHWIWQGALAPPKPKRVYNKHHRGFHQTDHFRMPARIRDNDGTLKAVVRILHRELRGYDYPYFPRRTHGCDYRCVNPFHLAPPPDSGPEIEPPPADVSDDLAGLVDEITNFIAIHGNDEAAIRDRFLLDYTEQEIETALCLMSSSR